MLLCLWFFLRRNRLLLRDLFECSEELISRRFWWFFCRHNYLVVFLGGVLEDLTGAFAGGVGIGRITGWEVGRCTPVLDGNEVLCPKILTPILDIFDGDGVELNWLYIFYLLYLSVIITLYLFYICFWFVHQLNNIINFTIFELFKLSIYNSNITVLTNTGIIFCAFLCL